MPEGPAQESIGLGHAARKAGRLDEALGHYRAALDHEPGSAEANSVYGLMLLNLGRVDEAEAPLRRAVEISPAHAAFRMNLAQLLAQQGRVEEAVKIVAGVAAEGPQFWWAWDRLGDLKVLQQEFADAALHFGQAVELRPKDPSILFKWSRANFDAGRIEEALRILDDAANLAPGHEAILRLHAEICEAQARWPALEQLSRSWVQANPKNAQAWRLLARAQTETGNLKQAMQNFRRSLELGWRDAGSLATFGKLCLTALEFESAVAALAEAETLDPHNIQMLSGQAIQLMFAGHYDEAQSYCRRSLQINPNDVAAYKLLTQLTLGQLPDDDFAALQRLAVRADISAEDRISAAFALADCLDTRGETDRAFAAYERANHLAGEVAAAQGYRYDPAARARQTDQLMAIFDSIPARTAAASGPTPVFIMGMPRSGTTLVESVIGAHSSVHACGERGEARWIMEEFLAQARTMAIAEIPEGTWKQWRDFYWREMPELKGAAVVTDKNPWNFDAVGLILRLFPDARIIHVRRNPVETGFSIYRNAFSKFMPFANRLEHIGHYYGEYARLMAHWERIAGDRVTTVQYEDLIGRFESGGPTLLAACGLEWEESCKTYWNSSRVISTMSTMQARQPPRMRAGRANRYAANLSPLVIALKAAGVDLESGSILDATRARLV